MERTNSYYHTLLVDHLLLAFGSRVNIRCWQRDVGLAVSLYTKERVKYGITGEADLQGIVAPHGRAFACEVKTGAGFLSDDQIKFRTMWQKYGGIYVLAHWTKPSKTPIETVTKEAFEEFNKQL